MLTGSGGSSRSIASVGSVSMLISRSSSLSTAANGACNLAQLETQTECHAASGGTSLSTLPPDLESIQDWISSFTAQSTHRHGITPRRSFFELRLNISRRNVYLGRYRSVLAAQGALRQHLERAILGPTANTGLRLDSQDQQQTSHSTCVHQPPLGLRSLAWACFAPMHQVCSRYVQAPARSGAGPEYHVHVVIWLIEMLDGTRLHILRTAAPLSHAAWQRPHRLSTGSGALDPALMVAAPFPTKTTKKGCHDGYHLYLASSAGTSSSRVAVMRKEPTHGDSHADIPQVWEVTRLESEAPITERLPTETKLFGGMRFDALGSKLDRTHSLVCSVEQTEARLSLRLPSDSNAPGVCLASPLQIVSSPTLPIEFKAERCASSHQAPSERQCADSERALQPAAAAGSSSAGSYRRDHRLDPCMGRWSQPKRFAGSTLAISPGKQTVHLAAGAGGSTPANPRTTPGPSGASLIFRSITTHDAFTASGMDRAQLAACAALVNQSGLNVVHTAALGSVRGDVSAAVALSASLFVLDVHKCVVQS